MMVEDQVRSISSKLPDDPVPFMQIPTELYAVFIRESAIASLVAMYYVLQVAKQRDRFALCQLVPTLLHCENERAYEDTFLHSLVSYLILMAEEFSNDDFCTAVFDDFLLVR